jgi:imidazolonepropionase-like amidohydrolase
MPMTDSLALTGANIYAGPTEEPIRDGIVLIDAGKITAVGSSDVVTVPPQMPALDCSGLVITAGFWNSHIHFFERKWANADTIPAPEMTRQFEDMLTRYGFTSVFDLASMWENTRRLRDRIESGEVAGPKIRSVGEGLLPKDPGIPPESVLNFMGVMKVPQDEVLDAEEATAAARKRLAQGVDGIKLFVSAPSKSSIPEAAMAAAAREAHASGKPVFAHPNNAGDVLAAVRAGVDVIAHTTPHSGPWEESLLAAMKERNVALTPTLWIWKYFGRHDRVSAQDRIVDVEVGQLRAWLAAGGTVLFGNDLGAVDYDPTEEYTLMAAAGMSFPQILASLTTAPAERFGVAKQSGRVAAGFDADLVILKQDPSGDIRALTRVRYTLRGGKIIYRSAD